MNVCVVIFLRVLSVFLAIGIFNMINIKRACDAVYGKKPVSLRGIKCLFKDVFFHSSMKKFLLDWYFGLFDFNFMIEVRKEMKQRIINTKRG